MFSHQVFLAHFVSGDLQDGRIEMIMARLSSHRYILFKPSSLYMNRKTESVSVDRLHFTLVGWKKT